MGNSKIVYGGRALIDLTNDTVTAEKLKAGETAHDKAGNPIVGTLETGAYDVTSTDNGDGTQTLEIIDGGGNSGGFTPPAVGFVPSSWDANGIITNGTWYGNKVALKAFYCEINGNRPFNLYNIEFADDLIEIEPEAFNCCKYLDIETLPNTLETINSYAFFKCSSLKLTKLPASIKNLYVGAFAFCTGLTNIAFEGMPTTINANAFHDCTNLTVINVPWAEGEVANAPWGATNATINYNYTGV